MKKIKRSTLIPLLLTVYLALMASIGHKEYAAGRMSALYYYGVIAATLAVIVLLHFSLKRRERLRAERLDDMHRQSSDNDKQSTDNDK